MTAPILEWVIAWWDGDMDKEAMHDAWRYAIKAVGMSARPNAAVKGGAGAFFRGPQENWLAIAVGTLN